jgi:hypothetical protein
MSIGVAAIVPAEVFTVALIVPVAPAEQGINGSQNAVELACIVEITQKD